MFNKALLLAAAAASVVSATCGPYPPALSLQSTNAPGFNSVSRPDTETDTFPTIGQSYPIIWNATGWGDSVTIYLLRGPGDNILYYSTLATDAPNNGNFSWPVDCSLTPDTTHWGLMVQDNSGCTFQWSSQFGINADSTGACSSSPTSAPAWPASSGSPPPPPPSGKPPPPPGGAPYPVGSNCTSTSTVWVNPTGGYTPPNPSYTPAYSNDGARFGMSMFGAAAAIAAAVMYL